MTAQLQTAGRAAEADRREGDAATEILAAASASKADLIVMGTHGRTGIARLVLGSVARNVLQHATCSVLIVREEPTETAPQP
jgi:nucleotide-binding universal stress UspA family protein